MIIPTRDRPQGLRDAVAAVARAAARVSEPVEVIVVDDGDGATSAPALDGAPLARLEQVSTSERGLAGPAAARNLGVQLARYDLLAFTDDDAVCDERWLSAAIARLRSEPGAAGIEGSVRPAAAGGGDAVRARIVMNTGGGSYLTASLFVRRSAFDAVGGFRSFHRTDGRSWSVPFREDTDFALRVLEAVGPVPFEPAASVLHPIEQVDLRRHVRLASYFRVDGAFIRAHPGFVPPLRRRPWARLRIRLATLAVLLLPAAFPRRTRGPALALHLLIYTAVSAQVERDLRLAGSTRPGRLRVWDCVRRVPRSAAWTIVAGGARLLGELYAILGLAQASASPTDARPRTP